MAQPLLEVKHLKTQFRTKRGTVTAVDDVSFSVKQGDTLGIVGESGCGKSVTSLSILQLLPHAVGSVAGGEILYKGEDIAKKGNKEMCRIRGREISMIFQDSMTSLNPVLTIGRQLEETISVHSSLSKDEIKKQALDILTKVGVSSPEQRLKEFPHQLSGGMRQRVMIAMALSCSPSLLIADEPTTALDVTIQAQIIDLMVELKKNINASIILITHDMGVVAEMADYIMVNQYQTAYSAASQRFGSKGANSPNSEDYDRRLLQLFNGGSSQKQLGPGKLIQHERSPLQSPQFLPAPPLAELQPQRRNAPGKEVQKKQHTPD